MIVWNTTNWSGFENDYRFDGEFPGNRYECEVRFANAEHSVRCFVGANRAGLYLLSHPDHKRWWWRSKDVTFRKNLQIPWSDLECRPGKMFFQDCLWFDIPSRKIHFYVAKDLGDKLLVEAGRTVAPQV